MRTHKNRRDRILPIRVPPDDERSELDYLIYNDPVAYADLVLNGNPEAYLKAVTEYRSLD